MLIKLLSDIPKFNGKSGEDPKNHVMTFHCGCCSNSLMDDSIRLHLFQRTLIGRAAKWYLEFPTHFFTDYGTLAMEFLTHFQLPIRYETGTKLLTSLRQTTSTHISDHIHEWRRRRRLIKAQILDQILADWFTKSLLPTIATDVAMGGAVTEEQAISLPSTSIWYIPSQALCMISFQTLRDPQMTLRDPMLSNLMPMAL